MKERINNFILEYPSISTVVILGIPITLLVIAIKWTG